MKESEFERRLVSTLQQQYPGAYVIKLHPNYIQGFPDRLFLYQDFWAAFELKKAEYSSVRPNQRFYIHKLNQMSFARFVSPETVEVVLDELQTAFESTR